MSVNYKSYEFRVYEHISHLDKLLHEGDCREELKQFRCEVARLRRDFETKHFRVAVVGEFNRGKTTFVNALLGKELLPADYLPTTAAINRITYSDNPNAYIIMKNGQTKTVPMEELAEYVTKLSAASSENAAQVQEAVLEYPSLFCRNGVDLIDTPGMNDEDNMNQRTISRLESIDLAIVAVDASMPFSMTECAFTVQLLESPQVCQIIIVVTKIDMIRERERQKLIDFMVDRVREDVKARLETSYAEDSEIMRKYHFIFDQPHVFAVSGVEALEALACNDMELFEKSGFRKLNDRLPQIIMKSQNNNVIINTERELKKLILKYRKWLQRPRPAKQALNELNAAFAKVVCEAASGVFILPETENQPFMPDQESLFLEIRKHFIQALGEMKVLSYEELKRVFLPVTIEMFRQVNTQCKEKVGEYLEAYEEKELMPPRQNLSLQLRKLLEPYPELGQAVSLEIDELQTCFGWKEADAVAQDFYWIHSPMPEIGSLGEEWNVMGHVDPVIREALEDYKDRCRNQIVQLFAQSKQRLTNQIRKLVEVLVSQTRDYIERLNSSEEKEKMFLLLDRLGQLERDGEELKEKFLAESGFGSEETEDREVDR